jgi:hypothetical protein
VDRKKQVASTKIESAFHGGSQRFDGRQPGLRLGQLCYDFVVYE